METATTPTVTTTTAPANGTDTEMLLNRIDLVAIVNALLLFAAKHCFRNSTPRIFVTWNTRDIIKEVAFGWSLEKSALGRDVDLHNWGDQCHALRQYLKPRYEALANRLNDTWTESRAIITRAINSTELSYSPLTTIRGRFDGADLVCKINCLLDFAARWCDEKCEPNLTIHWNDYQARKRMALFWSLKHVKWADDEYYQSHYKARLLRECLEPHFTARVSYNDEVTEARAIIVNAPAVDDSQE